MTDCPTTIEPTAIGPEDRAAAILTIDLDKIAENYRRLQRRSFAPAVGAVVKANGYGLGLEKVGETLLRAGARSFFVATLDEGISLRKALDAVLPATGIYILNGLMPGAEADYRQNYLQPVINSLGELEAWKNFCSNAELPLPAALHLDTGMNRLGLAPEELDILAEARERAEGVIVTLVMSHLACAEDPAHPMNDEQLKLFEAGRARLARAPASLANSSGCFLGHQYHFDLLRPGVALYGVNPTPHEPNPMAQVVRLQAKILQIREIDAPQSVGYGAAHRVARLSRIATLGVGYADGYHRALSSKASAWLDGQEIPIVGRISMDLITVDVTGISQNAAHPGALVDLLAHEDGVDRLAREAGTIGYEILTRLGGRFHRVYRQGASS